MKKFILFYFSVVLLTSSMAVAQMNYYNISDEIAEDSSVGDLNSVISKGTEIDGESKTLLITSIDDCYKQLDKDEAATVQKNYIKPYKECQRRLALKAHKVINVSEPVKPKLEYKTKSDDKVKRTTGFLN